jgi:zinc protease
MVLEDHRVPSISLQMIVQGAGGYYDPPDVRGLADFTATMMREGTSTRTASQIAERLETMAAVLTVGTSMGSQVATLSANGLSDSFDPLLDLAADILLNPSFSEDELGRFKLRTKASLMQQRSSPGFLASEMFARAVFGTHPAAQIAASPEALEKATPDALKRYHSSHYRPDHAVIGISGDISPAVARRKIEDKLAGWKKTDSSTPTVSDPPAIGPPKIYLVDRPGSVQTNLVVGTQAISRTSPDYDVVDVLNKIVGGGPTGRLFTNLREEKGYTYGAYSGFTALRYRGDWRASTEVRTEVTEAALDELMKELARIREERVADAEFLEAKRSMVASFALSLESPGAMLGNHITRYLYQLPLDYWDRYPDRIMAVTQEQVQAAAKKYLDPSRLQIVAVGDGKKVAETLKRFGAVEVYDTEQKRVGGGL